MDLPRLHELAMASPRSGESCLDIDEAERQRHEPVSSSYPTTHRRAA